MDTVFVTNHVGLWKEILPNHHIIEPTDYLLNEKYTLGNYRVINLCKDYSYQSNGYYVSLLAQARKHKITPSILTIQDSKISSMIAYINDEMSEEINSSLRSISSDNFVLSVYFGRNLASKYDKLSRDLYNEFPHPLFRVTFIKKKIWMLTKIQVLSIADVVPSHYDFIREVANEYCEKRHIKRSSGKPYHYDIAILHNPDEKHPPSDKKALQNFIKAGDKLGLNVYLITKDDYKIINEFDGLFIRETTAVNHSTYRFSRKAYAEDLFVVDDPESILKCANKVYMAEYLNKHHIPTPKTAILSKSNYRDYLKHATFPCIIKLPDSAFSMGVKKVTNKADFIDVTNIFFKVSDLIVAQEFMPSEYDWRVGIIDGQIIFACRYFMAKDHWQIYNWEERGDDRLGEHDSIPVEELPEKIKKIALKATKGIGNGLYGVDIKVVNDKPYVIEINDNPNIDCGVEDAILGSQLYTTIMQFFLTNLNKMRGNE